MMDFDIAADRLKKDQQSALARSRAQRAARTASSKAKREAAAARAEAEKRLKEKRLEGERTVRVVDKVTVALARVERRLGVADVSGRVNDVSSNTIAKHGTTDQFKKIPLAAGWKLNATSIHGEGDKIALPPSILETLTSGSHPDLDPWGSGHSGRPLAFRIGVLNPDYSGFPSSEMMKALVEKVKLDIIASEGGKSSISEESDGQMQQHDIKDMDVSEDESESTSWKQAYLDELSHRYLAYTHGSVIEFTQEDGCVGLPEPIATALLIPNNYSLVGGNSNGNIPTKRTVDPASAASEKKLTRDKQLDEESKKSPGDVEDDDEKTPGHPAYGKFDVPDCPIEITPIKSLPPGKDCTFTPTAQSIRNGFYGLKDIKQVLEQSLMRTRATLSKGDVIRTWRRGVSFDLIVSKLSPEEFGVVSCVNTDLNVDIGPPEGMEDEVTAYNKGDMPPRGTSTSNATSGRMLSEPTQQARESSLPTASIIQKPIELPPEPDESETHGVCVVQIRGRGSSSGRRRFLVKTSTMGDLFTFASQVGGEAYSDVSTFRLVTRFPRKVFRIALLDGDDCYKPESTLESAGICEGQLLFMIEQGM
jgi:hypothetical protein